MASRKLMEQDLLTVEDNIYSIPDILFRMFLRRRRENDMVFI